MGDDPRASGREAVEAALAEAGRPGELPDVIFMHPTPGSEDGSEIWASLLM